jgi:hypothetical protein
MKILILMSLLLSLSAFSQDEGDTVDSPVEESFQDESASEDAQEPLEEPVQDEMDQ